MLKITLVAVMAAALTVVAPLSQPASAAACSGVPHDINGDGYGDVVVQNDGAGDLGGDPRLHVFYGSASGLARDRTRTAPDDQLIPFWDSRRTSHGALAVGDFNGDGCADVASGEGDVVIIWQGGPAGLSPERSTLHYRGGYSFGQALAVGDFDGNGVDDLAFGAPADPPVGTPTPVPEQGGSVFVLGFGRPGDPSDGFHREFRQGENGFPGSAENNDQFGATLAAGDLDGNGVDDLVIGVPGENHNAGEIVTVRGTKKNPLGGKPVTLSENSGLVPGKSVGQTCNTCYTGDRFGDTIAAGDINGDGRADVAIRSRKKFGTKDYWTLSTTVLLAGGGKYAPFSRSQQFNDKRYAPAPAWLNTLLIARLGTDRYAELVTGRPNGNGSVIIRRGTKTGAAKATTTLTQATKGVAGSPELGDKFGASLAAIPVQKRNRLNLVVGIPGEWVTPGPRPRNKQKEQGQITQFGLGATLPTGTGSTTYNENSAGIAGSASDAPGGLGRRVG